MNRPPHNPLTDVLCARRSAVELASVVAEIAVATRSEALRHEALRFMAAHGWPIAGALS